MRMDMRELRRQAASSGVEQIERNQHIGEVAGGRLAAFAAAHLS
jgi:hypothetical protein